jgi:hypothetical protein
MKTYAPPSHIEPPLANDPSHGRISYDKTREVISYIGQEDEYVRKVADFVETLGEHPLVGKLVTTYIIDRPATYMVGYINGEVSLVYLPVKGVFRDLRFERTATVEELDYLLNRDYYVDSVLLELPKP